MLDYCELNQFAGNKLMFSNLSDQNLLNKTTESIDCQIISVLLVCLDQAQAFAKIWS